MAKQPTSDQDLSVIILTFNEELHIARAIASAATVAQDIYVVDSFSDDRTVEIAKSCGAVVLQNRFVNQAVQFQWALNNITIRTGWVMRLDADEVIEPDLAGTLRNSLSTLPEDVVGINLKRKHYWMGRWVKHGGRYPLIMLRVWRNGHGHVEDRWMDEHIYVHGGRTVTLDGGFADVNLNNVSYFIDKHNKYATREALEVIMSRRRLAGRGEHLPATGSSAQTVARYWIKTHIFNQLPFWLAAAAYFIWRVVFQFGFLDGLTGLTYHFLQGYWYRFLVGTKVLELELELKKSHCTNEYEIVERLSQLTGLSIRR
jgi:glycosyltransferase involved in cell wall biosynthesis